MGQFRKRIDFYIMKINEKIKKAREKLGLIDTDIVEKTDISIDEYCDIESYPDEIFTVTDLKELKQLCIVLGFDLFELFRLSPFFPFEKDDRNFEFAYKFPRHHLIKKRREELKLSEEELGALIGFEPIAIKNMEQDETFLESWTLELIVKLAKALRLPLDSLVAWAPKDE